MLYKIEVWSFKVTTILERVCDVDGAGRASATAASAGWRPRGGSGREAVVDLVAGHSVTPVTLKKSAIEKCLCRQIGRSMTCSLGRGHEQ